MKRYLLFPILLTFSLNICLSDVNNTYLDNFTWLKSEGAFPEELKSFALSGQEEDKYIKNLVLSGRIIYGSELNKYVEKIADNLLQNNSALRNKLKFYIVKSPAVNAGMTKQGIVLVNLGLLAQVNNESELAFVIGHEIVHYVEGHVYKEKSEKTKNTVSVEDYLTYHQSSREMEVEADKLSLERYYFNSPYSLEALSGFFDVLRYSYLPFDEIAFERKEVETNFYQFPDNYFLTSINPIRSRTDNIDTLSTHPNIQRRQQYLESVIKKHADTGKKFVQEEADFHKVKNLARFECINYFLTRHAYDDAIYNIYVLQQQFPDNKFLECALASAYYGFYKHKLNGGTTEVIDKYRSVEGQKQQVSHFLSKLSRSECNVLALRYIKRAYEKYSDDIFLEKLYDDALTDMVEKNKLGLADFSDFPADVNPDSIIIIDSDVEDKNATSKYERIKLQENNEVLVKPSEKFKTVNYMLVDIKKEPDFIKRYDNISHSIEDARVLNLIDKPSIDKNEKLLIWFPTYIKYKKSKSLYKTSSYPQKTMQNTIKKSVKKLDINYDIWNESKFQTFDTEKYNFYATIQQWSIEYGRVSFPMNLYQQQFAQPLLKKEGYGYVNFVHAYSTRNSDGYKQYYMWLVSLCAPVALPANLPDLILPDKEDDLLFYLVDTSDGNTKYFSRYSSNGNINKAYINSELYDLYFKCFK